MLIKNILYGYYDTQCLYAVNKLQIAEHLKNGKKTLSELAKLTQCDANKLYRILRFMAAKGIFDELPNQIFSLNEESKWLASETEGNLKNFINLHGTYFYESASKIYESLQNNLSPFEIAFGKPAWQLFIDSPDIGKTYNFAMQEISEYYGKLVAQKYNFCSYKTVVDIGGGIGSLLVNILKCFPHINGINFDLPSLKSDAEAYLKTANLINRCQFIAGDFFESIPPGGDLYIFKAVFHGKTDHQALQILQNVKSILSKDGRILLIERMINLGSDFLASCVNDINMLNVTKGWVRTLDEYKKLFDNAGFTIEKIESLEDELQLIEIKL